MLFLLSLFYLAIIIRATPYVRRHSNPSDIQLYLTSHNLIRTAHNATKLSWSTDLAQKAQSWVDKCKFLRTEGVLCDNPYGELHIAATGPLPIFTAIQQFAKDEAEYNPAYPTYNHWMQIVWKSTTEVGCAHASCIDLLGPLTGQATYHACLYNPPGNVIGQARDNVQLHL